MTKDMTQGSPMKLILGFSIPLFFGFLFQQFYNVVDTIIVGRFLGVEALASVGATGSLNFMIIGFCMGVCSGFAIPLSHKFGAGDYSGLRKYMMNAVYLSAAFAIVMTTVVVILCHTILEWMHTPANIIEEAYAYIVVIFIGIPVTYLYNLLSGIIRSLGDSRTPVVFLTIASVLNIGMDLLFILVFHMGVAGAAWATVISQGVSGVGCLFYTIAKFEILHTEKEDRKVNVEYMKTLCGMGIPMGLQYSITAIGSVILQSAVNTLGSTAVASVTAAGRICCFFCCPFDALGSTMATYGGQNVGAKKLGRIGQGLKSCNVLGFIYAVIACGLMTLFGKNLAGLFVDQTETTIVQNVCQFLLLNSVFYCLLVLVNNIRFLIQGMGYSAFAILSGVFEMIARTIAGFFLVPMFGFPAVCLASGIAWALADMFLIPAYYHVIKKTRDILGVEKYS